MPSDVGDFPGLGPVGGELGGQRAPEQGAAAVPLAVGAHEDQRFTDVRLPEVVVLACPQSLEIQTESRSRVGGGGGADPGASGGGVRQEHPAPGRAVAVGMTPGSADQGDTYARPRGRGLQGPADIRIEVTVRQRLGSPGSRLLDEQPGPGGGRRRGERFGRFTGSGGTGTHIGEPNLIR